MKITAINSRSVFSGYIIYTMKKPENNEVKLIQKYKKKVYSLYPSAFCKPVGKYFTIVQEQEDLSLKDILSEFCFVPQPTPLKAWELAQVSIRTTQNLNRTHPLRLEGMKMEDKISRMESRRFKSEGVSKKRKLNEFDSY